MFTKKCHCMCPYRFPYRFTTGLRQVSDIIQIFQKCLPKSVIACVPTSFPTGLRKVYDRFQTDFRDSRNVNNKVSRRVSLQVSLRVYDRVTTGFRQVSEKKYKYVPNMSIGFPTSSLQVHDRFTTGFLQNSEIPEMFTTKCHYMCPYRFPDRFTTGLRQDPEKIQQYLTKMSL